MLIQKTNVEGLVIIEPRLFKDERGYFFESFSQREFEEKVHKVNFVQDFEGFIFRSRLLRKVNWCVSSKAACLMWR